MTDSAGRKLVDANGATIESKAAAKKAIALVVVSRVIMAIPGMSAFGDTVAALHGSCVVSCGVVVVHPFEGEGLVVFRRGVVC